MQQLQLVYSNGASAPTTYLYENLPNAETELLYEDTINAASGAEVQGFVVQDPDLHGFLVDLYKLATPGKSLVRARQRFEREFANYHLGDYAHVSFDQRLNRWCIEVVTF